MLYFVFLFNLDIFVCFDLIFAPRCLYMREITILESENDRHGRARQKSHVGDNTRD